jgi:hypothetical protein
LVAFHDVAHHRQAAIKKSAEKLLRIRTLTALRDSLKLELSCGGIRNVWVECDPTAKAPATSLSINLSPNMPQPVF